MARIQKSRARDYIVAVCAVVVAVTLRSALDRFLDEQLAAFLLLMFAVAASAVWGGRGPGLLATFLSAAAAIFLLMEPHYSLWISDDRNVLSLLMFVAEGVFISWLAGSNREAIASLTQLRDELEQRVESRTAALQASNQALHQQIAENERIHSELQLYTTQLQRSNRELEDFASVASHDLQEPLRKIQAFGDRLASRYAASLSEEGQDYLGRMQNAAGRMQILINDLLAFARVTTRAQPYQPVDLAEVAATVVGDLESRIEQAGGRVEIGQLPTIDADPVQMRQLFQNLIGNGLKFRRPDVPPVVRVAAGQSDGQVNGSTAQTPEICELVFEDNGIGFDEKYLERIFNIFQRLHGRAEYDGTGIGLAVCRKIVQRHHGEITARSREGEGATFIVKLPVRQDSVEIQDAARA